MKNRYVVIEGSESNHCCFSFSIIDTTGQSEDSQNILAECFFEKDAKLICDLLNKNEESKNGTP